MCKNPVGDGANRTLSMGSFSITTLPPNPATGNWIRRCPSTPRGIPTFVLAVRKCSAVKSGQLRVIEVLHGYNAERELRRNRALRPRGGQARSAIADS